MAGSLKISQWEGMPVLAQSVFQHKTRYPDTVEPPGHVNSLLVIGQSAVTTSGADDHRRPSPLVCRGKVNLQCRVVHIADAAVGYGLSPLDDDFVFLRTLGPGNAVWP